MVREQEDAALVRTVFEYKGTPVMVSKAEGHWEIRAHGNLYSFRFLDDAISAALPSLTRREREHLVVTLLEQESQLDRSWHDVAA
jgi:hypothetical protein